MQAERRPTLHWGWDITGLGVARDDSTDAPRTKDFPGETFRGLKDNEIRKYGQYRFRRLVLEAWDGMFGEDRQGCQ